MQQTVLTYGEPGEDFLQILNCQTRGFEQQVVTDPTGTDTEYVRTRITVDGWLRVSGSPGNSVSGVRVVPNNYNSLVEQRKYIESLLKNPRQHLRYGFTSDSEGRLVDENGETVEGAEIFYTAQPPTSNGILDGEDVGNGPRCEKWSISNFAGGSIAKITATFVGCRAECIAEGDGAESNNTKVLTNRWSVRDSIDQDWYTTRVYSGRLAVTSAMIDPNRFRNFCLPLLQDGMRRQSMDFEVAADGKTLNYTVIDKEVAFSAPPPATSWDISHREETSDSKMSYGSIRATLRGHRNSNKKQLFSLGVAIIEEKLLGQPVAGQPKAVINHIGFTDIISSDQPVMVMVECDVMHARKLNGNLLVPANRLGTPLDAQTFAKLPFVQQYYTDRYGANSGLSYNNNRSELPIDENGNTTGGAIPLISAVHSYFQNPCDIRHQINIYEDTTDTNFEPPEDAAEPVTVTARVFPEVPEEDLEWASAQHNAAPYTHYRVQSTWDTDHAQVHLPVAAANGAASSSSSSSTSPTAKTIALGAPASTRRVRIHAERIGQPPSLPKPEENYALTFGNKNARMLRKKVVLQDPETTIDGTELYVVDAQYDYGIDSYHTAEDDLLIGMDPSEKGASAYFPSVAQNSNTENDPIA